MASCISGHVVSADVSPKYMKVMAWENAVSYVQTDATTPNIVGPTMLEVVACLLAVVSKQTQQLPKLSSQQCWELSRACWQWYASGCNNSQHCRANNVGSCCVRVGSSVQTDAATPNNMQQGVRTDATCNIQQYWKLLANNVASVCPGL